MFRLSKHGFWEILIGTVLLALCGAGLAWLWWPLAAIPAAIWLWLIAFFRDPDRNIPLSAHHMVSPADGLVSDVMEITTDSPVDEPALRIGIFLNVFNVHVNRSPCAGKVARVIYKKGKFLNAMDHSGASSDNESNTIVLVDEASSAGGTVDARPKVAMKQIVGLIARRIICTVRPGDTVTQGERVGLIKFGSRTELYVPLRLAPTALVRVGQKVVGGRDVLVRLGEGATNGAAGHSPASTPDAQAEPHHP